MSQMSCKREESDEVAMPTICIFGRECWRTREEQRDEVGRFVATWSTPTKMMMRRHLVMCSSFYHPEPKEESDDTTISRKTSFSPRVLYESFMEVERILTEKEKNEPEQGHDGNASRGKSGRACQETRTRCGGRTRSGRGVGWGGVVVGGGGGEREKGEGRKRVDRVACQSAGHRVSEKEKHERKKTKTDHEVSHPLLDMWTPHFFRSRHHV